MKHKEVAKQILDLVGGPSNITGLTHCITRLRFNLADESKADDKAIEAIEGVSGIAKKGGQYQVILGSEVTGVYREITKLVDVDEPTNTESNPNQKWYDKFFDLVTGIFTPILTPLCAAGMLKAVLAILTAFKWVDSTSSTYQVINFMADATFYFLPILLASSAAKKFKTNPMLAMMLAGMLIHPNFVSLVTASKETGEAITVFGLPIYNATYSSSVIPIILGVWFMSKVEPIADRLSPKAIKFFISPLITMLVSGIVTLCVLGPIGYIIAQYIGITVTTINTYANWLVPTLIGALLPFLVMTGTHHALTSVGINNRMTLGFDSFIYPGQLASNVAQGAAALALSVRTKDEDLKQMASANGITAICGITEPVLFGITMKYRTNLIASSIGGAVGGFFMGSLNVKNFSGGSPGLLTLPSYIGLDAPMSNFYLACAGAAIAFVVSFVVSFVLNGKYAKEETRPSEEVKEEVSTDKTVEKLSDATLAAPINGKSINLSEVDDPTFAKEIMGKGGAIIPSEGKVYSPVDGKIATVFRTKHAITMVSNEGVEIIIHIGIDTVKLEGKYFDVKVKDGDIVHQGDLIAEFDMEEIKNAGYDLTTPIIIANTGAYQSVNNIVGDVKVGDAFINVKGE